MKLLAIDPGSVSGAVALFDGETTEVADLDVVDKNVDAAALARAVRSFKPDMAVIELVHAMPKQGVVSTFKFGFSAGVVHGVLAGAGVPMTLAPPHVWKKALGLTGKDKEAARALAIRLYPQVEGLHLKKHQNRAEALLIGHWFNHRGAL